MRNKRTMLTALVVVMCGMLVACDGGTATVSCSDIGSVESDLGILNVAQLRKGELLWLDSKNHLAERIYTIPNPPVGSPTPTIDTTSLITTSDFSLQMSANVPSTVSAQVQAYVNSHTQFTLGHSSRVDISDPIAALNTDSNARARAAQVPSGDVLLFVSGEVTGTSINVSLQSQSGASSNVNVVKFGSFSVAISYDCSNTVQQVASGGAPLLWKGLQVAYDPTTASFTFGNKPFQLKDYKLSYTIQ